MHAKAQAELDHSQAEIARRSADVESMVRQPCVMQVTNELLLHVSVLTAVLCIAVQMFIDRLISKTKTDTNGQYLDKCSGYIKLELLCVILCAHCQVCCSTSCTHLHWQSYKGKPVHGWHNT